MGAYFGALGFTKPLEKLVLHAVPLQRLLNWLSKPKGPNLVEAYVATAPDKALVLAVTKPMLYGEEMPLVGVGLMYKPHYISTEPFSATYMHLHVWHADGSSMLEYEPETFPQGLMQGPKMAINLRPLSNDHWNITTDLVLPLAVDKFRWWHEAKWVAQGLEGESEGAKVSPMKAPAPRESPQVVVGSSRAALPTEITHQGEEALEMKY